MQPGLFYAWLFYLSKYRFQDSHFAFFHPFVPLFRPYSNTSSNFRSDPALDTSLYRCYSSQVSWHRLVESKLPYGIL